MKDFIYSQHFSAALALLNGYFCIQSLNNHQWGWALLSGAFCWLCIDNWRRAR